MTSEKEFRVWILEKISEILEETHQMGEESCPFCCAVEYPVDGEGEEIPLGEPLDDADYWHTDHYDDCLITVLEKCYIKIDERGLWC